MEGEELEEKERAICIICKKKPMERAWFCSKCFKKDIFIKIKAFRKSQYSPFKVETKMLGRFKWKGKTNKRFPLDYL